MIYSFFLQIFSMAAVSGIKFFCKYFSNIWLLLEHGRLQ